MTFAAAESAMEAAPARATRKGVELTATLRPTRAARHDQQRVGQLLSNLLATPQPHQRGG
jgi:hypothetical protein